MGIILSRFRVSQLAFSLIKLINSFQLKTVPQLFSVYYVFCIIARHGLFLFIAEPKINKLKKLMNISF